MTEATAEASKVLIEELKVSEVVGKAIQGGVGMPVRVAVLPAQPPVSVTGPAGGQVRAVQAGLAAGQLPGTVPVQPKLVQGVAVAKPGLAATVKAAVAAPVRVGNVPPRPKGIISGNTRDLENGLFRFVLFSETNATKSTTAARFDTPEWVRIIGTRHEEQLVPLKRLGYTYSIAQNAEQLNWLLRYPETEWPEWAEMVDPADPKHRPTLILDDGTEAVNMLLDDNEWIDGKEVKNQMRTYVAAGKDLRDMLVKTTLRKNFNFGMTALAKAKESPRAPDEEIYGPWLPPAMLELVMSEFEFVFYIDKAKRKLLTEDTSFTYSYEGPGGPKDMRTKKRTTYSKTKIDFLDIGKGVLNAVEDLDLANIWKKIRKSQAPVKPGGVK